MGKLNKKMKQKTQSSGGGNKQAMQFNHALGQHILKNPLVIQALVEKVTILIVPVNCETDNFLRPHSATQTRCWRLVRARGT